MTSDVTPHTEAAMHQPGSGYLSQLKRSLTGDPTTPAVFICNFEVEAHWAAGHVEYGYGKSLVDPGPL